MTDLVSVVIPVYNTNERFKACFASVLNQKYQYIEVILVDDGSSDTSAQICDTIAASTDSFPVTVIHKPNGGVSRARNLGIDYANGKYLVFIDSDDQVTPDYISDFMDTREKYPDAGHIWCGFKCKSQDNTKYVYSEHEKYSLKYREDYFDLSNKVLAQSPCLRLYDVSVLKDNNIRMIESLSLAEDIIFNLEYLDSVQSTEICVVNAVNYTYLDIDPESLNRKFRTDLIEIENRYLNTLKFYIKKWGLVDSESNANYYNVVYFKLVETMHNTFLRDNKMLYISKILYNNEILRSEMFMNALSNMSVSIPIRLRRAYHTKKYFWVRVYERMVSIMSILKKLSK